MLRDFDYKTMTALLENNVVFDETNDCSFCGLVHKDISVLIDIECEKWFL